MWIAFLLGFLKITIIILSLLSFCSNDLYLSVKKLAFSTNWRPCSTISLKKQYTHLNSEHNMNNTSEVVTLSVIGLILVAPVKNGWLLKWPKIFFYENSIIARGTLSSNISNFWPWMLRILNHYMGHELPKDVIN